MLFCNKLECLSLVTFLQSTLTSTLAYYDGQKSFIALAPGANVIKPFKAVIY
jgi:hypothetical protein